MYYREQGEKKWLRCTYAHYIHSGLSDLARAGEIEIKHSPIDTPKQSRQKRIASALRSLSCAVAQLQVARMEISNITKDDLPGWIQSEIAIILAGIDGRTRAVKLKVDDVQRLNKYITQANKESNTP